MDTPDGWTVWSETEDKIVLAYRPDVFDGSTFPAPCLPTLYITHGRRSRRPGRDDASPDAPWVVTLFLEPDVNRTPDEFESRDSAIEWARELARSFAAGDVDYRALYQVPREDYFAKLDELTGQ